MLFSEPKIPQLRYHIPALNESAAFSALQRAENSSIRRSRTRCIWTTSLSVLFSEPKIPQLCRVRHCCVYLCAFQCSSASRKFLNARRSADRRNTKRFQCSSASRKFLNRIQKEIDNILVVSFSALQRAENSSIVDQRRCAGASGRRFQCSSASRKFLNCGMTDLIAWIIAAFSALQRAENSSIRHAARALLRRASFSALQRAENSSIDPAPQPVCASRRLSVLFSEPKIPQFCHPRCIASTTSAFSALQRAENSSIGWDEDQRHHQRVDLSVLFSEPKIPQFRSRRAT